MDRFEIIVQNSPKCVKLLKYIDKNIDDINQLKAEIKIKKISADDEILQKLKDAKITGLPALIPPDGDPLVGIDKVMEMFEDNLAKLYGQSKLTNMYGGPSGCEFGSNSDLSEFYRREFEGFDNRKRRGKKDRDDEEFDDAGDIERRMAEYQRNVPKHRRTAGRERDVNQRRRDRDYDDEDDDDRDDNIYDSDDESFEEEPTPQRGGRGGRNNGRRDMRGAGGDEMDRQMMAAWMDNNGAGE